MAQTCEARLRLTCQGASVAGVELDANPRVVEVAHIREVVGAVHHLRRKR